MERATRIRKLGSTVLHPGDPEQLDRIRRDTDAGQRVVDLAIVLRQLFPQT